jgi:hypothetical protein
MSASQIDATALLCRMLDRDRPEFDGQAVHSIANKDAAAQLLRERLLVFGDSLGYVTCTECWTEQARVVREISGERVTLLCPECEDVTAPRHVTYVYKAALTRFVSTLLVGLDLAPGGMKMVELDRIWRLGTTQPARGKALTWYFARQMFRPERALRMKGQLSLDKTGQSSVVLTSSDLPLPAGSPMADFDVRSLETIGRVCQSKFEFFADRLGEPGPQILAEAAPGTTLLHVKTNSTAFVDGTAYLLEPSQQKILLALMGSTDHELDKAALKTECGSQAERFSPVKEFQRNPVVYDRFIHYLTDDRRYALTISDEDRDWLH